MAAAPLTPVQMLPIPLLQPTLPSVIADIRDGLHSAENVWCSVYREGEESVHGKVRVMEGENEGEVELLKVEEDEGKIVVEKDSEGFSKYTIACPTLQVPPTPFLFPSSTIYQSPKIGIDCFDLSPDGKLFVVGSRDGLITVGNVRGEGGRKELRGHKGDVRSVSFFPSSEVILSSSTDMSLKIYSALNGDCVRTLTAHTRPITSQHILSIGKYVISSSLDGTIRYWNVGQSKCAYFERVQSGRGIVSMAVDELKGHLAVGLEGGSILLIRLKKVEELDSRMATLLDKGTGRMNAGNMGILKEWETSEKKDIDSIALSSSGDCLAAGSRTGVISIFSLTSSSASPLLRFKRNTASITSLSFTPSSDLLVTSADGLASLVALSLNETEPKATLQAELGGIECERVVGRVKNGGDGNEVEVVTGAAMGDGVLRRYLVK